MKNRVYINVNDYVNLIGDGAIASTKTADGRLIPVLILDTREKKDLELIVKMHEKNEVGDVTSIWTIEKYNHKSVNLVLNFKHPVEVTIAISFNVSKHSNLIDGIILSRGVYLQPGSPGDRIRHNINAPKILVEIPARTTFPKWDEILIKAITKKLKKEGVGRKSLKEATENYISIRRDVWGRRLKN